MVAGRTIVVEGEEGVISIVVIVPELTVKLVAVFTLPIGKMFTSGPFTIPEPK